VAVFLAAFGYLATFRSLGWFLEDEGALYYQYLRVHRGELPYRDFFTGYAPLGYYLHAWIFSLLGVSIESTRLFLAFVHAITATGLYALARRLATPGFALVPPVLFLVVEPNDIIWIFSLHNCPYPSWYALAGSVLAIWALLRAGEAETGPSRGAWLFVTGLLAGLTLLFKQNTGVYLLWGISGFLVSARGLRGGPGTLEPAALRFLRIAYLGLIPLGAIALTRAHLSAATIALFAIPTVGLATIGALGPMGAAQWRRLIVAAVWVFAGVVVAVAPWMLVFTRAMGLADFLGAVFPAVDDVVHNLYHPFPAPETLTVVLLACLALTAAFSWLRLRVRSFQRAPSPLAVGGAVFASLAVALCVRRAVQTASWPSNAIWAAYAPVGATIDNLLAYATLLVLGGALVLAWRQRRGVVLGGDPRPDAHLCVTWIGACSLLGYYPRMDMAHWVTVAPPLYVVASGLLASLCNRPVRAGQGWRVRASGGRALRLICAAAIGVVVLVKVLPPVYNVRGMKEDVAEGAFPESISLERARIRFPVYTVGQRRAIVSFRNTIDHVLAQTRDGEEVFAFPALTMVNFLAKRENPTRHDYFLGNNVSPSEQEEVIRTLERKQVRTVVVTDNPRNYYVRKSRPYTGLISEYLEDHFAVDRRFGGYKVLRRREPVR
jgi:hypothetical protein